MGWKIVLSHRPFAGWISDSKTVPWQLHWMLIANRNIEEFELKVTLIELDANNSYIYSEHKKKSHLNWSLALLWWIEIRLVPLTCHSLQIIVYKHHYSKMQCHWKMLNRIVACKIICISCAVPSLRIYRISSPIRIRCIAHCKPIAAYTLKHNKSFAASPSAMAFVLCVHATQSVF